MEKKLYTNKAGEPFKTKAPAAAFIVRNDLKNAEIIPIDEGGFVVKADEKTVGESVHVTDELLEDRSMATKALNAFAEDDEAIKEMLERPIAPVVKRVSSMPWKPATLLDIPAHMKDPRFVYRFCDKKKDGNLQKKLAEGWEIDSELSKKIKKVPTINDGKALDSTMQIRELIVMRMPKEMANGRQQYYAKKAGDAAKSAKQTLTSEVSNLNEGEHVFRTYGDVVSTG